MTKFNIALALIQSKIPQDQLDANQPIKDMFSALNTTMADIIKPAVITQVESESPPSLPSINAIVAIGSSYLIFRHVSSKLPLNYIRDQGY